MIPQSVMVKLATLGLSPEQVEAVAGMLTDIERATKDESGAAIEARRSSDRERKARQRHGTSRDVTGQDVTSGTDPFPDKERFQTSQEITPNPGDIYTASAKRLVEQEFEAEFWPAYPRKAGKGQALKAWTAARKRVSAETILAGARRYAEERRLEDQNFTRHPATWLNGDGWLDEPAPARQVNGQAHAPPKRPKSTGARLFDSIGEELKASSEGVIHGQSNRH